MVVQSERGVEVMMFQEWTLCIYIYNLYLSLFLMTYAAGQFNWIPVCLLRTLQALQIKPFQCKTSLF